MELFSTLSPPLIVFFGSMIALVIQERANRKRLAQHTAGELNKSVVDFIESLQQQSQINFDQFVRSQKIVEALQERNDRLIEHRTDHNIQHHTPARTSPTAQPQPSNRRKKNRDA